MNGKIIEFDNSTMSRRRVDAAAIERKHITPLHFLVSVCVGTNAYLIEKSLETVLKKTLCSESREKLRN